MKLKRISYCYPKGKYLALTMSYDDGYDSDKELVEIFNRYGIRGTFNLNAGMTHDEERRPRVQFSEMAELYRGHEIASHSYTHPSIARCDLAHVSREILEDRIALEKVAQYPVRGFAYPNGSYTENIQTLLPALGIRYARLATPGHGAFSIPDNAYAWEATCHHKHNLLELGEKFLSLSAKKALQLMYVWGHSYEFDNAGSDTSANWELIEKFCAQTGGKDFVWYATNIEIIDWLDVMHRLQFAADGSFVYNPSVEDAWLTVDGETVCVAGGTRREL